MNVRLSKLLVLATVLAACGPASDAPVGRLLVSEDVEFPWNAAYNQVEDGLTAVVPLDVMVYEAGSGVPMAGVDVVLSSDAADFVEVDGVSTGTGACAACVWDAYRDEYIDLGGRTSVGPLSVTTDASGLARAHAVVDALVEGTDGFLPAVVVVRAGGASQTLRLDPR